MRSVFEACTPRPDVLSGDLRDDMFAAHLEDVARGVADPVYGDPVTFFANTYPASGLRALLEEALGRATGRKPAAAPVIRLETSFGGGKTHSLIALYHLATGGVRPIGVEEFVKPELLPDAPIRVVTLVGSALDPAEGMTHDDVTTRTLWGELAHQLGAYPVVQAADEAGTAPGTHTIEQVLGPGPVIVLMDEMARYLEVTQGRVVGKSTLADQTIAFLMALFEAASSSPRVVVVLTLASSSDAFGEQTEAIQQVLRGVKAVSARKEHVITPTTEDEIAAVVRQRLFERVDTGAAVAAKQGYHEALRQALEAGADLPAKAGDSGYAEDVENDYPFHPELLRTLNEKVSTIPNFQRTRGALRLLARTIRRLWETRPADAFLVHPHHVDLADDEILNDLTSRLDRPVFRQVAEADIANPKAGAVAHARAVDDDLVALGRPPYGARIATTVFLHSLVQGKPAGITPTEAKLAVFTPGDDLGLIERQIDRLLDACWFLDLRANELRFSTEPSLTKIVADEIGLVGVTSAKAELDQRIRHIWAKGTFDLEYFPAEPADIEDTFERPTLAIVHYDAAAVRAGDEAPPDLVVHLADHAGAAQGFRRFRNHVLFLVADADAVTHTVEQARRYLALRRILDDPDRFREFAPEQQQRLRSMGDEGELLLRVAITRMYRHLYYPDAAAPDRHGKLAHALLPAQDQAGVARDQSQLVLRTLRDLDRVLTADSPDLAPKFVRDRAWPANAERVTPLQLRQEFASRVTLKILLDLNKLKEVIKLGVRTGHWLYYDPRRGCAWGKESSTTPLVEISSDVELVAPEAGAGLQICDVPEEPEAPERTCPVCGRPVANCTCGEPPGEGEEVVGPLVAEGAPGQAFQAIADQAVDQGVAALGALKVAVEGSGAELLRSVQAMALAVPQVPRTSARVTMTCVLDLADTTHLQVSCRGPWERYRPLHDVLDRIKPDEVTDATGNLELTLRFEDPLDPAGTRMSEIRDVFVQLNPGVVRLTAEPAEPAR